MAILYSLAPRDARSAGDPAAERAGVADRDDSFGVRTTHLVLAVLATACGGGGGASGSDGVAGSSGPTGPSGPTASTGSAAVERVDPSAECDGLVPAGVPAPVDVEWSSPPGPCGAGTADGTGHVAVPARSGDQVSWQAFSPAGAAERSFSAWPVVPQPSGWHGLAVLTLDPAVPVVSVIHRTFSPEGAPAGASDATAAPNQVKVDLWVLAQDPRGGSFTAVVETDAFHNHWSDVEGQRFDAAGAGRWPANVRFGSSDQHSVAFAAAGVSSRGESLTLWQHSAQLDAWWIDGDGKQVATEQRAESYAAVLGFADLGAHDLELVPLLDGGLALRSDGTFRRVFPHLSTRSAALPAWLADRAGWTFRFTRGNRGYALFPPPGQASPDCSPVVELRSPSGRLCGLVTLAGGGPCTTGAVDQGWDGTVVEQRAHGTCRYRFWPGMLGP
jgi:hypothetical protein